MTIKNPLAFDHSLSVGLAHKEGYSIASITYVMDTRYRL